MGIGVYETSDHKGCYVNDILMDHFNEVCDVAGAGTFAITDEQKKAAVEKLAATIDKCLCIVKMYR